jgi:tRNA threonylcarbamoyladenosine biosynthesis protein TsaB
MKLLALDTSSPTGSLAILEGTQVLQEITLQVRTSYSEQLMTTLDQILKELQLSIRDLEGVAVSHGPGSFTGLRIGMGVVKALAYALEIPLWGVSTLEALVVSAGFDVGKAWAIIDARQGEFYGSGTKNFGEQLLKMEAWPAQIAQNPDLPIVMSMRTYMAWTAQASLPREPVICEVKAREVGQLALQRPEAPDHPLELAPHYLKISDAEARLRGD